MVTPNTVTQILDAIWAGKKVQFRYRGMGQIREATVVRSMVNDPDTMEIAFEVVDPESLYPQVPSVVFYDEVLEEEE